MLKQNIHIDVVHLAVIIYIAWNPDGTEIDYFQDHSPGTKRPEISTSQQIQLTIRILPKGLNVQSEVTVISSNGEFPDQACTKIGVEQPTVCKEKG